MRQTKPKDLRLLFLGTWGFTALEQSNGCGLKPVAKMNLHCISSICDGFCRGVWTAGTKSFAAILELPCPSLFVQGRRFQLVASNRSHQLPGTATLETL
jgi:hypothetical protein